MWILLFGYVANIIGICRYYYWDIWILLGIIIIGIFEVYYLENLDIII